MSHSSSVLLVLVCTHVVASGCGGDGFVDGGVDAPLWAWNRSQFEILELYVHEGVEFEQAENLLDSPLAINDGFFIELVPAFAHLTVVRTERNLGDRYAITTEEPVALRGEGQTIVIFDTSFRLLDPEHPDNIFWEPAP